MSANPAIVTDQLTKSYGSSRGIVDVSMTIEAGEVFGFLGPNGAGKTTTIRTLLDFIRPTAGRATVLGLDPHRDSVEIHRRVGYLPGEFSLYEHMTGRNYLGFFATLRGGVDRHVIDALAERLQGDLDTKIASLSHGNRQKIGLIQAFMHQPPVHSLLRFLPTYTIVPLSKYLITDKILRINLFSIIPINQEIYLCKFHHLLYNLRQSAQQVSQN